MRSLFDDRTDPVVLAGIRRDVAEDAEFRNVRIVFGIDSLEVELLDGGWCSRHPADARSPRRP